MYESCRRGATHAVALLLCAAPRALPNEIKLARAFTFDHG
jgi:hypothetical protein